MLFRILNTFLCPPMSAAFVLTTKTESGARGKLTVTGEPGCPGCGGGHAARDYGQCTVGQLCS